MSESTVPSLDLGIAADRGTGGELHAGLDIGGSKVSAVVLDGLGQVRAEARLVTSMGPDGVVATAVAALTELGRQLGISPAGLDGVGVGIPGLVDAATGVVTHAVNLGVAADPLPLGDRLRDWLGVPVEVENDVNAAALGAAGLTGRRSPDLAYLSIGTGLAAGLVLAGRLRRGSRGAAGELGHIPVDPAGPLCGCGQRGCLETLASGSAIAERWPPGGGEGAARALFTAAERGDPAAGQVRDIITTYIAAAVRVLVLTVDVETVVLGGGAAEAGPALLQAVSTALERQAAGSEFLRGLDLPARLALAPAGQPVAAIGAALLSRTGRHPRRPAADAPRVAP